jgi:dihydrodipicolinate synthase/N-acetylneuraminate lyase
MSQFVLGGCVVPMITPLMEISGKLKIEESAVNKLITGFCQAKVSAIFILGNAGSFQFLSLDQKLDFLDIIFAANPKLPILVGVSDSDWKNTRTLISHCEKLPVSALVWIPYFQSVTVKQFMASTKLPVIYYNNPAICNHRSLTPDIVKDWHRLYSSQLIGIKESAGDFDLFTQFAQVQIDTGLPILMGDAKSLVKAKDLENHLPGYHLAGGVPVHVNVDPETYVSFLNGDQTKTEKIYNYSFQFPTIDLTIRELVNRDIISAASLSFWLDRHN